ncbi:hypothetical protein SSP35_02_03670 [Streptomyces sp. NBRC 110611]|uniref:DUF1266 domain-containing protein n=1 Tax=Streptomyces sp. NBRC 110611 TaxID=1621259 RepID=UPI000830946D|nr:DUF1266 domain-containing protein [Streptomyces sp. NBRC 110611]GAU65998.1 hypothetical protein SSP35_02_03670 [Streptomyces sp. NBRC 110611]
MPPTDTERRLCEATARGDVNGQIAAIAGEDLYLAAPLPGQDPLPVYDDPAVGSTCIAVLTRGMLPPWQPQQFFDRVSVEELAQDWPNDKWKLAVNPGTPCAAYLSAFPAQRAAWQQTRARFGVRPGGLLVTFFGGPLHGPVAQGLACGAPVAVHHSVPWNELGTAFLDPATDAETLRAQWSVTDPATWQQRLDQLFGGQFVPADTEAALRARNAADATDAPEIPELVTAYEQRLRTEGLLPADGRVVSLRALDLAHAVGLVRWGLSARLCTPQQAEHAVQQAGARAREVYGSWEEYAAGYLLGRLLAFDNGWFGPQYAEAVHLHRILTQDPSSPWRALPFT